MGLFLLKINVKDLRIAAAPVSRRRHSSSVHMASERPSKKQKIGDARDESMQEAGQRPMSRQLDSITSNTTNGVSPMSKQPKPTKVVPSPVQLSSVDGLPADCNVDTVSLGDIVGHPLIKECWAFNYLIDVDFLL